MEIFYPQNRYVNFYVAPLTEDEQVIGPDAPAYVMLVRDITQTRKLTEEKIESERLNALTMLAAGVAHEIGNPLNSLGIHLQLLEKRLRKHAPELYEQELKELIDISAGEVKRLDFIVDQFLSAIRPSLLKLEPRECELADRGVGEILGAGVGGFGHRHEAGAAFRSADPAAGRQSDEAGVLQPD